MRKSTFVNKILNIFIICNIDPVLPIDVKFSLTEREVNESFDEETFEAILASNSCIPGEIHESAIGDIRKTQDNQMKDFVRRHLSNSKIKVGCYLFT